MNNVYFGYIWQKISAILEFDSLRSFLNDLNITKATYYNNTRIEKNDTLSAERKIDWNKNLFKAVIKKYKNQEFINKLERPYHQEQLNNGLLEQKEQLIKEIEIFYQKKVVSKTKELINDEHN